MAIVQPEGHPRRMPLISLGYRAFIEDALELISAVEACVTVDRRRIYAAGLSMGGQEALLFAGRHPELLAACFVFSPIIDLAAWHDDLCHSSLREVREYRTAANVREEVGGTPLEVPHVYAERSPLSFATTLVRVPTCLWWSAWDVIVPGGADRQARALYERVKTLDPTAPIAEYEHTFAHGLRPPVSLDDGWRLHEFADYELALTWLLRHRRPA